MNAIILAAGVGSRLKELTADKPKCMVHVNGRCIIDYQLDALQAAGVSQVFVVAGFQAEKLKAHLRTRNASLPRIEVLENTLYLTTNNMYSLYMCASVAGSGDVLVLNGDVVFEKSILADLVALRSSAVCVDVGTYHEESMKVALGNGGKFIQHITKTIRPQEALGSSIDVYRFSSSDWRTLGAHITQVVEVQQRLKDWTEVAIDELAQRGEVAMVPFDINHRLWYEIDTMEDLRTAEMLFGRKQIPWAAIKAAFVDLDGTIYCGGRTIPGADTFVKELRKRVGHVYFLSNNSSKSHEDYRQRLASCGIEAKATDVILSSDALGRELQATGIRKAFIVGTESLKRVLAGYGIRHEEESPKAVILGYDTELTYAKLAKAALLLRDPALPYFATHTDVVCPVEDGSIPDAGAMIALFERATKRLPRRAFGKPNAAMVEWIYSRDGIRPEESILFGDRVYTDHVLASNLGAHFVAVLSGESRRADYEPVEKIFVFPSVADIFE